MLFALGFMVLFTIGGLTGLYLGALGTDIHLHDTYFVVAHFHFVMVGGMVLAYLAGLHYWWPKMTGRMYSDFWSRLGRGHHVVGFFLTFMPQFVLGYHGMPRRYPNYPAGVPDPQHAVARPGRAIQGVGYLMPSFYLTVSLFFGRRTPGRTRGGRPGWSGRRRSPPPPHNFDDMPVVACGPYEYSLPSRWVMADGAAARGERAHARDDREGVTSGH